MKILLQKEFLLFLAIFSGFSASVCAQNNQAVIVKAISDGDAHELVKYFHTKKLFKMINQGNGVQHQIQNLLPNILPISMNQ